MRFDVDGRWFNEDGTIDTSGRTPGYTTAKEYRQSFLGSNKNDGGGGNGTLIVGEVTADNGITIGDLIDAWLNNSDLSQELDIDFDIRGKSKANVYIETDGVGHVYIEIDGTVYSYGRYNGSYSPSSGKFGPYGDGILLRLEGNNAKSFISERIAKYPTSKHTVEVDGEKVKSYYNTLYDSGKPLRGKDGYYKYGRAVDTYTLVGPGGNNCTTIVYKALNYGGAAVGAPQTPAGMLYDFQQAEYIKKGYNPGLWGPKR